MSETALEMDKVGDLSHLTEDPPPGQFNNMTGYEELTCPHGGMVETSGVIHMHDGPVLHPLGACDENFGQNGNRRKTSKEGRTSSPKQRKPFWISVRAAAKLKSGAPWNGRQNSPERKTDSFLERFTTNRYLYANSAETTDAENNYVTSCPDDVTELHDQLEDLELVTSHEGDFLFYWLGVLLIANLYNIWLLVARESWPEIQTAAAAVWFTLDYFCDFIFVLDILVQFRTGYLEHGLLVTDSRRLAKQYMTSHYFALDILALAPTDLLYLVFGVHPLLRFPRFLKIYRARQFYYKVETSSPHPNSLRLLNLAHILLLLTHWFAAVFHILGELSGIQEGLWMSRGDGSIGNSTALMYLTSFYWSTITLTTIGDIPTPTTSLEFIVQIIGYMMGVFVFATIVGQVGTVIDNRNAHRMEFERHVDHTKRYMRENKVPRDVQQTILRWYDYTWSSGEMMGKDVNTLSLLPAKLRTELALHVNLHTLKRVTFFKECPPEFLHELVLKMRFMVITPGDLIIRKGQIAREMFIISDGLLEVIGDDGIVLATLETGDFFGEIGILNLDDHQSNKRVADVRSVGYSELFTLVKEDILGLLKDYPQAERVLHQEGKKRLQRNGQLRDASSAGTSRNSAIEEMRQSGMFRCPVPSKRAAKTKSAEVRPPNPQPPTDADVNTLPVIRVSEDDEEADLMVPPVSTSSDFTRDVITSIEDVIKVKLETVMSDTDELRMRNEHLELQIRKLQETNERQTDEIMRLRQKVKRLNAAAQTESESTF